MQNYRDNFAKFREFNAQVLGISVDDTETQGKFAKENRLEFPLLSDLKKEVARAYGVLVEEKGFASRVTFVINKQGKIHHIEAGNSAMDPAGALAALKTLQ